MGGGAKLEGRTDKKGGEEIIGERRRDQKGKEQERKDKGEERGKQKRIGI